MTLIKFILIFGLIYYLLKFIGRAFFPYILKHLTDKMENQARQQFDQDPKTEEGEITIKQSDKDTERERFEGGEDTDYEEIKD